MRMNLLRIMALAAMLPIGAAAQYNSTVYQQAFNARVGVGRSVTMRNIGAQYQQLTVTVTDAPNQICSTVTGWSGDIHIDASLNGTSWFSIGAVITAVLPGTYEFSSVNGAFPYISINYAADSVNAGTCAVSAWYAGTLTGNPTGSAPTITANDNFVHSNISNIGGSGFSLLGNCFINSGIPAVYGMTVSNTGSAGSIQFGFATSATGTGFLAATSVAIPASDTKIWPESNRAYFYPVVVVSPTPAYRFLLANGIGGPGSFNFSVTYRCE